MARPWRRDGDIGALDDMIRDLPTTVVAAALGVPEAERPAVVRATAAWVAGLSARADDAARAAAIAAMDRLLDHLSALGVADTDDAAAHVALLMQPHEATAGWIGAGVLRLARDAALRDAALAGSLDDEAFGTEVLRHDPPVQNTRRTLAADVSIADCVLRTGDSRADRAGRGRARSAPSRGAGPLSSRPAAAAVARPRRRSASLSGRLVRASHRVLRHGAR